MKTQAYLPVKLLFLLCITAFASEVSYNYYVFSSSWLGTECNFTSCWANQTEKASHTFWSIHGLWPDYWQGYPAFCEDYPFVHDWIEPELYSQMEVYWTSAYGPNDKFYDHEWTKHGTCWNDPDSPENTPHKMNDYFELTLSFGVTFNIYASLESQGIVPSATPYQLSDISAAFANSYGNGTYLLECKVDSDGNQYFGAANICMDLDYNVFPCPQGAINSFTDYCQAGDVYYPVFE